MAKKQCTEVSIELLHKMLRYDPDTGALYWRVAPCRSVKAGDEAGSAFKGYRRVRVGGRQILNHRVIWAMNKGYWPTAPIDHHDLNRSNNRIENLREATTSQNRLNCPVPKNSRSGFKGVKPHGKRWVARIPDKGKTRHIGTFATPEEAARAYDRECRLLHGDFSNTNFRE